MDLIEGFNAHTFLPPDNRRGLFSPGSTYTEVQEPDYDAMPEVLIRAVRAGTMVCEGANPLLLMAPAYAKLRKVLV